MQFIVVFFFSGILFSGTLFSGTLYSGILNVAKLRNIFESVADFTPLKFRRVKLYAMKFIYSTVGCVRLALTSAVQKPLSSRVSDFCSLFSRAS